MHQAPDYAVTLLLKVVEDFFYFPLGITGNHFYLQNFLETLALEISLHFP